MKPLTYDQRLKLLALVETFVEGAPIEAGMLTDPLVVYRFLFLSRDQSDVVFQFVQLITPEQLCQLTLADILSEEVMLEMHLLHGFDPVLLGQWLRGLPFSAMRFFESIAQEKDVLNLSDIMAKAMVTTSVVDGVRIDSVLATYESLDVLVDHACKQRINVKQFRQLLVQLAPSSDDVLPVLERVASQYQALKKIERSSQVAVFRVYCALFDFVDDAAPHMAGVVHVFDQLIVASTLPKAFGLLNQLPYAIIQAVLTHLIGQGTPAVIDHLNEALPQFNYGQLRKIVRRGGLALNYKHD